MFRRIIKNTLGGSTYNKHCTFDQFPMKISKYDEEVTNQARIRLLWDEQVYYDKVRNLNMRVYSPDPLYRPNFLQRKGGLRWSSTDFNLK